MRSIKLRIFLDGFLKPVNSLGVVVFNGKMIGYIAEVILGKMMVSVGMIVE